MAQVEGSGIATAEIVACRNCVLASFVATFANVSGKVTNWYPPATKVVEGTDSESAKDEPLLIVATKGILSVAVVAPTLMVSVRSPSAV